MNTVEINEEISAIPETERQKLRKIAQNDLFVLSKGILGYPDVTAQAHGIMCQFIQAHPSLRRMVLMPRAHLKSTIGAVAHSIQLVIGNPEYERILLVSETMRQAKKFLREIKAHFENGHLLRKLFPELLPHTFNGPGVDWSGESATLVRQSAHREPHWQVLGVGGALTGGHFTRIKGDDIMGFEAFRSPAKLQEVKDFVDTLEPFLIDQHKNTIDFYGTRWSSNDVYKYIMDFYGKDLAVFSREAVENGQIIFPELHTWEEYNRLMTKSPRVWYAQYCNNPQAAGRSDFASHAIGSFRYLMDGNRIEIIGGVGVGTQYEIRKLYIVITADPNSGSILAEDMGAIIVSAMSHDDRIFTLETWSDRANPTAFVDKLFELSIKWGPRVVGIERAGQQNTDHYFTKKCEQSGRSFNVQDLPPRNKMKEDRVRGYLDSPIRSGSVYLLPSQQILRQQIADFPNNDLIDELDCFAYGRELWRKPWAESEVAEEERVISLVMRRRSRHVGY